MGDLEGNAGRLAVQCFSLRHSSGLNACRQYREMVERFQKLRKSLPHENLCRYLHIEKGKFDRVYLVSEHFEDTLRFSQAKKENKIGADELRKLTFQMVSALSALHRVGIVHRNLSLDNVLLDREGNACLSEYGLFYLTHRGQEVEFAIGSPYYVPPEDLAAGPFSADSGVKSDTWSVGCILLELISGKELYLSHGDGGATSAVAVETCIKGVFDIEDADLESLMNQTAATSLGSSPGSDTAKKDERPKDFGRLLPPTGCPEAMLRDLVSSGAFKGLGQPLLDFVRSCLTVDVGKRASAIELLTHPYLAPVVSGVELGLKAPKSGWFGPVGASWERRPFPRSSLEAHTPGHQERLAQSVDHWVSVGGCVETKVEEEGDGLHRSFNNLPVVYRLDGTVIEDKDSSAGSLRIVSQFDASEMFSRYVPKRMDRHRSVSTLSASAHVDPAAVSAGDSVETPQMPHMAVEIPGSPSGASVASAYSQATGTFMSPSPYSPPVLDRFTGEWVPPTVDRDMDVDYQRSRVALFQSLLVRMPATRNEIRAAAATDIPPTMRAEIWAAILGVARDVDKVYGAINTELKGPADHQIEVDVVRCHQYHPLLSSSQGQRKLTRVLKAWVATNYPAMTYWQGLDSVAAPFVVLHYENEAMAYGCLSKLVSTYLRDFFAPDNTSAVHRHLAIFTQLLSYHDPELSYHLQSVGFSADLYAIPWFLTLLSHILSVEKVYHVWDKLLAYSEGFFIHMAVAVIRQMRSLLLPLDFDESIATFSHLPVFDVEKALDAAVTMLGITPFALDTELPAEPKTVQEMERRTKMPWIKPVALETLTKEVVPRISPAEMRKIPGRALLIDLRDRSQFDDIHIKGSKNVPFETFKEKMTREPTMRENGEMTRGYLEDKKRFYFVLISDSDCILANEGAKLMIERGFPFVSILNGGVETSKTEARELLMRTRRKKKEPASSQNPVTSPSKK